MALGHEVLAIDSDEARVNELAPDVTHAVQLDAVRELGEHSGDVADDEGLSTVSRPLVEDEPSVVTGHHQDQVGTADLVADELAGPMLVRCGVGGKESRDQRIHAPTVEGVGAR